MNIFYIINGRFPTEKANGYQVSQMCQAFSENGAQVSLLRPQKHLSAQHLPFKNNLKEFYHLRQEPKVIDVWSFDFQSIFHKFGPFLDRFQFLTNLLHTISFVTGLVYFFFKRTKTSQDVLYLRDINILSWLSPFLDSQLKKNVVLELHYFPVSTQKKRRYVRILAKAKAVVCITNKMKTDLVHFGYPKEKIWVEHDGVDLETFKGTMTQKECRQLFNYPEDIFIVGYVGNFHTNGLEKGVDDLIRAAPRILKEVPHIYFYFVGGPMDRVPFYQSLIQSLNLPTERFLFFDRRPVSQVPASMAACDILTIPLPWNEHFAFYMSPMKLFEYMASGRCIVATNVESLREILTHEENSLLAQHSDIHSLADQIIRAASDTKLREKLASQARQQVQYHSWKKRAERVMKFIG